MPTAPKAAKLSVALTPELTQLVQQAVATGDYASTSEVIREALREWKHRRTPHVQHPDELRQLWAEGLASSPGRHASIEDIKHEARRQHAAAQAISQ